MSRSIILTIAVLGALGSVACGATSGVPPQTVPSGPTEARSSDPGTLPVGQELDVRLQSSLSSATAKPEQRFEATTVVDVTQSGNVLVPAGSVVRGIVAEAKAAGRIERAGSVKLSFDQITVRGEPRPMRAMATQLFKSGGVREEAGTAGVGAGAGGIIGGLIGGVSGAVLGAVIGAGGAIMATEGKDIELPAGTIVRIRLDSPVDLRK